MPSGVGFRTPTDVWAVGEGGTVLSTANGGR